MKAALIRYGATFLAGAFAMWLWHSHVVSGMEADAAKAETKQAAVVTQAVIKDAKQAGENSGNYLDQLREKDSQIADLRQRLDDGSVRLRLCGAERQTARVQASNSRAAENEARADSASDREAALRTLAEAKKLDAWVDSCHAWVNR